MRTRNAKTLLLLFPLIMGGCNPTGGGEDLIADLAGDWFGYTDESLPLDLDIKEDGRVTGFYDSYPFTGQASLYGTQFELSSIDIDMSGQYIAESERLEGDLYDYRDPEETVLVGFSLIRQEE